MRLHQPVYAFTLLLLSAGAAAWAQPSTTPRPADPAVVDAERKAWEQVLKSNHDFERTAPAKALAAYKAFFDEHPNLTPPVGGMAGSYVAELYLGAGKDPKAALELTERLYKKYGDDSARFSVLPAYGEALVASDRGDEAIKLLRGQWAQALSEAGPYAAVYVMRPLTAALLASGKEKEAVSELAGMLTDSPQMIDPSSLSTSGGASEQIYTKLVDLLLEQERYDEALSWGKLRFMVCGYDEAAIKGATTMLAKIWTSKTMTPATADEFIKAQTSADAKNPLADIKLPAVDAATRRQHMAMIRGGQMTRPSEVVSLYLLDGNLRKAMLQARKMLVDNPASPEGENQVTRVFKAADLNLIRANAFVEYFKSGQGANPIDEFLKEHPAGETAPTPTS